MSDGDTGASRTSFAALAIKDVPRVSTGIEAFDKVLGGGLVRGSTVLLAGPPKSGKSTALVQTACGVSRSGLVLYASGEQSTEDVALIVHRTNSQTENVELMGNEGNVYRIVEAAEKRRPVLLIVDSLQTSWLDDRDASEGSAEQVRAVTSHLTAFGKRSGISLILICHVTKTGAVAGPKQIEHLVDTVVEIDRFDDGSGLEESLVRELWSSMNRNASGPGVARAWFEMTSSGLKALPDQRSRIVSAIA
jgi:DNA repair protein RadA/Sms